MRRVLVTGASGFIGRHALAPLIARGFEVHGVTRGNPPASTPHDVHWHQADLLDPAGHWGLLVSVRPTHLLHLAWYAVPGLFWHARENDAWLAASTSLFDAAGEAGVERIVGAGSCAEYEWSDGVCDEETTPIAPATPYGRAKAATSAALAARATRFPRGCAWGRVFFLYGPHEPPARLVASILRAVIRGEPAPVTEGRQRRDFLYVGDAGAAFAALTDSAAVGAMNVGSGEALAIRDVATRAAAAAGRPDLLRIGAVAGPPDDPPAIVAVPGRLSRDVGWQPEVTLERGLAASVAFWRTVMGQQGTIDPIA